MTVAVHHLNCATMRPALTLGGRLTPPRMVAHCLLVVGDDGLALVDTGFGSEDLAAPGVRLGRLFVAAMRPALDRAETAAAQVRRLGFDPADVRDIALTHLDLDHVGGIGDFRDARIHVFADELAAARRPATILEKNRYVSAQWAHDPRWVEHAIDGEQWLGFDAVRSISEDLLLIPLRGHTRGHAGVAVRRPAGGWFLHAGDAYFNAGELERPPSCPPGLRIFQTMMQADRTARHANQERLRSLNAEHGPTAGTVDPAETVTVFSAHDAAEFDALAGVTD